jgi:hypothetical protein
MQLFDEYAASFARGERPDLRRYLARAGEGREELARLVDGWLTRVEPPDPDEDAVALAQAWMNGEPPLLELRRRRGLKRDEVVDFLITTFRLDPKKREKVKRSYHEVETGQLVPVEPKLIGALAELLGSWVGEALSWHPKPVSTQAAYYRTEAPAAPAAAMAKRTPPIPAEQDEIDLLFRPRT